MTARARIVLVAVGPRDLRLAASPYRQLAHLSVRRPGTGHWTFAAACGALAWSQAELDAQLTHPPNLAGLPRCGARNCAALWSVYDSVPR